MRLWERRQCRFGRTVAKRALKTLRQFCKTRPINVISLVTCLEAEQMGIEYLSSIATRKKSQMSPEQVCETYNSAIAQFLRLGTNHYGAIANELAGKFFLKLKDDYWAEHYLSESCRLYMEWDAVTKVEQMASDYSSHLEASVRETMNLKVHKQNSYVVQGRSRFNAKTDSLIHSTRQSSSTEFLSTNNGGRNSTSSSGDGANVT